MRLNNVDILQLLPAFMQRDPTTRAIADAINPELRDLGNQSRNALIMPRLDELSEEIIDELAIEYDIAWYLPDADIDAKRAIVQDAFIIHAHIGTPWAIETVARRYFGDAVVEEWWQYEGDPYHFRLATGNIVAGTRDALRVISLVEKLKNARSVFDGLYLDASVGDASLYVGSVMQVVDFIDMEVEE